MSRRGTRLATAVLAALTTTALLAPTSALAAQASTDRPTIVGGAIERGGTQGTVRLLKDGAGTCGGSLISPRWILTAAHCVDGDNVSTLSVRIGQLDYRRGIARAVRRTVVHGGYNRSTYSKDIALVELYTPVRSTTVRLGGSLHIGDRVRVYGWGAYAFQLKHATQEVTYVSGGLFGTKPVNGHSNYGDSGGPHFHDGAQVGIVSRTYNRADRPGHKHGILVHQFRSWIRAVSGV